MKTNEERPRQVEGGEQSANPEQGKERKLAAATLVKLLLVAPWAGRKQRQKGESFQQQGLRLLGSPRVGLWMWLEDRLCIQERFSEKWA